MATLRRIEDLDPLERLSLIELSYSRLNNYEMCPAKYFFTYVRQEPQVFSPHATLGNIVHEVLENHDPNDIDPDHLLQEFEVKREKLDPETQINDDLIDVGKTILIDYADRHEDDTFNVVGVEIPFTFVLGNAHLRGFIDRVDMKKNNTLHIIDYKTGAKPPAKKYIQENLQLKIYFLAMHMAFPDVETFDVDLYFLRAGKFLGHTYTVEDVPRVTEEVASRIYEIISDPYFHYTENSRICYFCDHAQTGACVLGSKRLQFKRW